MPYYTGIELKVNGKQLSPILAVKKYQTYLIW